MHPDELDLDETVVRRLLARQFPEWARLPLEPVEPRGTDNALFRLGEELVVRLPRLERTNVVLEKELRWLPTIAPLLPLEAPRVVETGEPTDEYPFVWAVYTWLEGENATPERIGDPRRLVDDLVGFISALQAIDASLGPPPGAHNFLRGAPVRRLDEHVRTTIDVLGSRLDADELTAVWDDSLDAPDWTGAPIWVHGDLDSRNLLVRDGRLACVLDFGCLGVGDPACDVMAAWKLLPRESRPRFRSALGVDDATWVRARGWVLAQALGALVYYTPETNPTLYGEAERWLVDVLAEPTA